MKSIHYAALLSVVIASSMNAMQPFTSMKEVTGKDEIQYLWEGTHPGEIYQGECNPSRPNLYPGYIRDAAGKVVLAATATNVSTSTQNKN